MKLPYTRFVRQVSNGGSFSRYGYIEMMQRNAVSIETEPWREATCKSSEVSLTVNQITRTDAKIDPETKKRISEPTYTAWIDDVYDVFAQAGDGVKEDATMCGYLGCVAYRFTLPDRNPSAMNFMDICIQRDRYLRAGVRVTFQFSDEPYPSDDWNGVIHRNSSGDGVYVYPPESEREADEDVLGVSSWGFLGQKGVSNLLEGRAEGGTFSVSKSSFSSMESAEGYRFLFVYITLEDAAAYWDMYNEEEKRFYYIEGSAVLVPSQCDFIFSGYDTGFNDNTRWVTSYLYGLSTIRDTLVSAYGDIGVGPSLMNACMMTGFISPPGRLQVIAPAFNRFLESMARKMVHGGDGSIDTGYSTSSEKDAGEIPSGGIWGDPSLFIRLSSMETYANWPQEPDWNSQATGVMVLARACSSGAPDGSPQIALIKNTESESVGEDAGGDDGEDSGEDGNNAGAACFPAMRGYSQIVFGFCPIVVPPGMNEYSRMRLRPEGNIFRSNISVSLNIWKSSSFSCIGQFANAALAALACNPEMFTGSKTSITGNYAFSLNDYENEVASEKFNVSASARLLANVSTDVLLDGGEIVVENLSLEPGDVLIIAPKVEKFRPDPYYDGTSSSPGDLIYPKDSEWDGNAFFCGGIVPSNARPSMSVSVKLVADFS